MTEPVAPAAPNVGRMDAASLLEAWPILDAEERVEGFELLDSATAADFFLGLPTREQADLITELLPQLHRAKAAAGQQPAIPRERHT